MKLRLLAIMGFLVLGSAFIIGCPGKTTSPTAPAPVTIYEAATPTFTPTQACWIGASPTCTPTLTFAFTNTSTFTSTPTNTLSSTVTNSPTLTVSFTLTYTKTLTLTITPTITATPTGTIFIATPTATPNLDITSYIDNGILMGNTSGLPDNFNNPYPDFDLGAPISFNYGLGAPDIAYHFTITTSKQLFISLCGSSFDTILYLRTNPSDPSTTIDFADDSDNYCQSTSSSLVTGTLQPGIYYLIVDGYTTGDYGPFSLSLSTFNPICNLVTTAVPIQEIEPNDDYTTFTNATNLGTVTAGSEVVGAGNVKFYSDYVDVWHFTAGTNGGFYSISADCFDDGTGKDWVGFDVYDSSYNYIGGSADPFLVGGRNSLNPLYGDSILLASGDYYVVLFSISDGSDGNYRLIVQGQAPPSPTPTTTPGFYPTDTFTPGPTPEWLSPGTYKAIPPPATVNCPFPTSFGNNSGTGSLTAAAVSLLASQANLPGYGMVSSMNIYLSEASGQVQLAIYSDNSGAPASLVMKTDVQNAVDGWNTIPINPTYLGGNYWLACQIQGGTQVGYSAGGNTKYLAFSWDDFPQFFPIINTPASDTLAIYVTYCTENAPTATFTPTNTPTSTPTATSTPIESYLNQWGSLGTGNGQFGNSSNPNPSAIALAVNSAGTTVYATDSVNNRVEAFDSSGNYLTQWGIAGVDGAGDAGNYGGNQIAVDGNGNVYVGSPATISVYTFNGSPVTQWTGASSGGIAIDSSANCNGVSGPCVYLSAGTTIQKFDSQGGLVNQIGNSPFISSGIAVDPTGYIYVVSYGAIANGSAIEIFNSNLNSLGYINLGPYIKSTYSVEGFGLVINKNGTIYMSSIFPVGIFEFTQNDSQIGINETNHLLASWGSTGSGDGQFEEPWGMAIDGNGYLYVSDSSLDRIQKFAP